MAYFIGFLFILEGLAGVGWGFLVVCPTSWPQFSMYTLCFLERLVHISEVHSLGLVGQLCDMAYVVIFYLFIEELYLLLAHSPIAHFIRGYYIICLVVEVVTWHTFLRHTSPRCSLIFFAWLFQLHLSFFDIHWRVLSYLESHTWHLHALAWSPFYFWRCILEGAYVQGSSRYFRLPSWRLHLWREVLLSSWELTTSFLVEHSICMAACKFIHGVSYLGIHTCGLVACILWTPFCFGGDCYRAFS